LVHVAGDLKGAKAMSEDRRARGAIRRLKASALGAALLYALAGATVGAAQQAAAENPYNDELMKLSPQERAAKLADHLGVWCIGIKPFFMGMTKDGAAKGYSYWSLTCAGTNAYLIQISPDGKGTVMDCRTFKQGGQGRECYKTF
jgi:hypothetical protein